jgi:hypothetical protein
MGATIWRSQKKIHAGGIYGAVGLAVWSLAEEDAGANDRSVHQCRSADHYFPPPVSQISLDSSAPPTPPAKKGLMAAKPTSRNQILDL